ncbi:hypothetical protein KSC_030080 [Ktedonobacter sp. SOSP1-52]|uniref:MFS transporter n=1 Tax=Ktedonobacter sp. SOSP1-52 TaxID=2778366 RepID=UPI0019154676|nr:MFS transporter [Ktedonobacter sp. SOSP1-52]GHO64116.1 hypothetical protein KSC_030080 [Ktedonobacter sp. SOSP1-52]
MMQEPIEGDFTLQAASQAPTEIAEPLPNDTGTMYLSGRPFKRYAFWYLIASLGMTFGWSVVPSILVPNQIQAIEFARFFTGADAHVNLTALEDLRTAVASGTATATAAQQHLLNLLGQFDASRAQALSLISSLGVFCTMFVQPIVGILSDRTRSRFGRRTPWILFGGIVGALFMVSVRYAPTVAFIALLWTLAQAFLNLMSGPLTFTVADRVAESNRGTVSSLSALGNVLGGTIGAIIISILFASLKLDSYFLLGGVLIFSIVGFVWVAKEPPSTDLRVPPHRWGDFFRGFLVPLRDSDFRWVWIARILLLFGYSTSSTLNFFMLQSYIHPALSAAQATQMVPLLSIASLPAMVLALVIAGRLSDKLGRRKPFVITSSVLMAVAFIAPLISATLPALFVEAVLAGIAFGIYLPIDQALFVDILPDKDASGRDLGIANLATNFGQILGPLLAAQVVALTGSYGMIWTIAAVLVIISAVVILPVKRVR